MATGSMAFEGDTQAVVFDAILNRDPRPLTEANPAMPPALAQILEKTLEKDRNLRCQSATELKTDLLRLKRKLDASRASSASLVDSKSTPAKRAEQSIRSIAVLYFENLSGVKEDEYLRDGITEDILTDLSKIKGLNVYPRTTVLAFRDQKATAADVCRQLRADYALEGSLRRAGNRLRINTQLVDAATGFPVWSERYDREMSDIFEVQDEIAHKIAEALRITLSPQEQAALAAKPTQNAQAYDLYLQGRSYARRLVRQDAEFALQMFQNAVALDPSFALAHAAIASVCAQFHYRHEQTDAWLERARQAGERAEALDPDSLDLAVARSWLSFIATHYEEAIERVRPVIARRPDCEGAYELLLRALFSAGRYQEIFSAADAALEAVGADYNVYVPIMNALAALGKDDALRNIRMRLIQSLESHLREVPEDARARILLAIEYAAENRTDDAAREAGMAMILRPNDSMVLYNAACTFCGLSRRADALDALAKAWKAGFRDAEWTRRDPDLVLLHGDPEFERLYPEKGAEKGVEKSAETGAES
jgi:TolB-like protein